MKLAAGTRLGSSASRPAAVATRFGSRASPRSTPYFQTTGRATGAGSSTSSCPGGPSTSGRSTSNRRRLEPSWTRLPTKYSHGSSPDGRWLAYASDETGTWEVYARGFGETQGKWQISLGGGSQPVWRGDGRELFYVDPRGALNAVGIGGDRTLVASSPQPLFQTTLPNALAPFRTSYAVSRDGQRFLLNALRPNPQSSSITIVLNGIPR